MSPKPRRSIRKSLRHPCWVCGDESHVNPHEVNSEGKVMCKESDRWNRKGPGLFEKYKERQNAYFQTPAGQAYKAKIQQLKSQRKRPRKRHSARGSVKKSIKKSIKKSVKSVKKSVKKSVALGRIRRTKRRGSKKRSRSRS